MEKLDYYCHNKILNTLELNDQINYLSICRIFYYKLTIESLSKWNQNLITNYIFRNVITLDVSDDKHVTDVSFMKKLKILKARGDCGIEQNGIDGLDLIGLHVSGNKKITNVSFMKKLKILDASLHCGIDQNGLNGLDLIELNVNDNNKIKNVSFMKHLKILIVIQIIKK
jgi:hypothetical protein